MTPQQFSSPRSSSSSKRRRKSEEATQKHLSHKALLSNLTFTSSHNSRLARNTEQLATTSEEGVTGALPVTPRWSRRTAALSLLPDPATTTTTTAATTKSLLAHKM
ncbi:hypothetical protein E2C01_049424 [Portunus trituberculatus]|uniref:Uncharacterized protein n=1 Tax=Portunus trituberculatus TaxID=210409 RepID=A0A5B7GD45_PORTR|nr:hypothetical protein [Portunus trituberculatus]